MSVEKLLASSKDIDDWLDRKINGLEFKATDRLRLSGACFDQVHEHVKAIRLLLQQPDGHRLTGSAFSLVRPTFETFLRGLWLRHCATDEEILKFQSDKLEKNLTEIVQAIESKDGYNVGVLARVKRESWSAMCSYAHGGYLQAVRRITSENIAPNYSDDEIESVIRFVSTFALLAGYEAFSIAGRDDLIGEVLARIKALDPSAV